MGNNKMSMGRERERGEGREGKMLIRTKIVTETNMLRSEPVI